MRSPGFLTVLIAATSLLCSCGFLPQNPKYTGPAPRPAELEDYYSRGSSYGKYSVAQLQDKIHYKVDRYQIESQAGQITIDYYHQPKANDDLILVFPLLGGKNVIVDYFAEYFVDHGFDAAIVHRVNDFKNPAFVDRIEDLLRENVVRDRIAIDFFEKELGKKDFGSFGISRGAINVAMTAGVDERLRYNVMALGGTDIVDLFRKSNQRRLKFYRNAVMAAKNFATKEEFFKFMTERIKTDPSRVAKHIDARNTLLLLSMFDRTVPFSKGMELRQQIGEPKTVLLAADHYTSILYTQYAPIALPFRKLSLFPFDYIESESLAFYRKSFGKREANLRLAPMRVLQIPFNLIIRALSPLFEPKEAE